MQVGEHSAIHSWFCTLNSSPGFCASRQPRILLSRVAIRYALRQAFFLGKSSRRSLARVLGGRGRATSLEPPLDILFSIKDLRTDSKKTGSTSTHAQAVPEGLAQAVTRGDFVGRQQLVVLTFGGCHPDPPDCGVSPEDMGGCSRCLLATASGWDR